MGACVMGLLNNNNNNTNKNTNKNTRFLHKQR